MQHANGHSAVLATLTDGELSRLERVLSLTAHDASVDLHAIVAEMREHPTPKPPELQDRGPLTRGQIDGGRLYELTLIDPGDFGAIEQRYEREWSRVDALHATGLSYEAAWQRIRADDRMTSFDLDDLDLDDDDDDDAPPKRRRLRRRHRTKLTQAHRDGAASPRKVAI